MKYSLKWKLALSYSLLALALVAVVSLFSRHLLKDQFEQYIIRQQEIKNQEVTSRIAGEYDAAEQVFEQGDLETIGMNALEEGMILRVSDAGGSVLWDAMVHNNGLCHQMLQSMAEDMRCRYPNFEGAYEEKNYPIEVGGVLAGSVSIGYYGPFYLSDNDAAFIDTLNRALLVIGAVSLLLAVSLGLFMARRISRPIEQAINVTERIAKGDYSKKGDIRSGTTELDRLITSVNSLSSELQNQEQYRKRLTADIAHELRTPLSTLQGNVEALIDGIWQPDEKRLLSLHEEILRLTRLVLDLEKLAQLESENTLLNLERVDLKLLAEKTALSYEAACHEKNIRITVTGESLCIPADADKLRQVLINLISNSLKYTPDGGTIAITVSQDGGRAKIVLEDSGAGIAPKDIPHIFERFYRADGSRSSRPGGAGIGLAIVEAIIQKHGGMISVESAPEKGARFVILLPDA